MMKIIRHYTHKYIHIAGYTLLCQLVIYGVQWPILMAWGYAQHPLSIIGNIVFTPFISTLIILCTMICIGNICGVTWKPLYQCVDVITHNWLSFFTMPCTYMHMQFATPHWSVLVAIPVITGIIVWHIRGIWRANITLILAFIIIGSSLKMATPYPHRYWIDKHIMVTHIANKVALIQMQEPRYTRYTRNWIIYNLIPTLRQKYATDVIDYVITRSPRSRLANAIHTHMQDVYQHILLSEFICRITQLPGSHERNE